MDDRFLVEQVDLADLQPGQQLTRIEDRTYRVMDWMPACPPGVDKSKWALVTKQLEAIHSVLEEATQEHLVPESVSNLLNEATVTTRKLGVEMEAVIATLRRQSRVPKVAMP